MSWSRLEHHHHHIDQPIVEFSMGELHSRLVVPAYLHDGSENMLDEVELKVSDGKFVRREKLVGDVRSVRVKGACRGQQWLPGLRSVRRFRVRTFGCVVTK